MRIGVFALLYMSIGLVANPVLADTADILALREGDMRKLAVHDLPVAVPDAAFTGEDGTPIRLADFAGQIVLVNFWATWCAPCRKEMPQLAALQSEFGGDRFTVLTIATGRNQPEAMTRFMAEIDVDNLPLHTDPRQELARAMGVLGLPVTLILDREGQEIARLVGDADWHSDSARAIISALLAQ